MFLIGVIRYVEAILFLIGADFYISIYLIGGLRGPVAEVCLYAK